MGYYLNPEDVLELYKDETEKQYFVDKTGMLDDLINLVEHGRNYIAVTGPRR